MLIILLGTVGVSGFLPFPQIGSSPIRFRLSSSSSSSSMAPEDEEYAKQIFGFAKKQASPALQEEYDNLLRDQGHTSWQDASPELQAEFLRKVELEQLERMVQLEERIQQISPDIHQAYVFQAQQEAQASLLTASPTSQEENFSIAHERPDLMIRMEHEFTIWQLMEQQMKEFAPELYQEVKEELVSEQQKLLQLDSSADTVTLSSVLMNRNDLLQKVTSKAKQLTTNVEDITQAVMKKSKSKRKAKEKGLGFGK